MPTYRPDFGIAGFMTTGHHLFNPIQTPHYSTRHEINFFAYNPLVDCLFPLKSLHHFPEHTRIPPGPPHNQPSSQFTLLYHLLIKAFNFGRLQFRFILTLPNFAPAFLSVSYPCALLQNTHRLTGKKNACNGEDLSKMALNYI